MNNKKLSKVGFTLIEILIAVLIIGVLTTIALPMYQGAVDKSKWARLIAPARAVSTAQEAAFMNYGGYTANIDDLDVSLPEGNDMTYTLYTTTNGDDANFIRITSSQLNDVRLAKYYKNNEGFEDQLYCEAKNGNDRANKLCGKLLKGQELLTTDDGYKMYLIEDVINKVLCNKASLWWSGIRDSCYLTAQSRCDADGGTYNDTSGFCKYQHVDGLTLENGMQCSGRNSTNANTSGHCKDSIIQDGGVCLAGSYGCKNPTINDGGVCYVDQGNFGCDYGNINSGGICAAGRSIYNCRAVTVNEGGICYASSSNSCNGQYRGGCCCGAYCPSGTGCAEDRCLAAKSKLESLGYYTGD